MLFKANLTIAHRYVLSIDNEVDFEEYMRNLLDFSNQTHVEVYENIKAAKFGKFLLS